MPVHVSIADLMFPCDLTLNAFPSPWQYCIFVNYAVPFLVILIIILLLIHPAQSHPARSVADDWTDVLQSFTTSAAADSPIAVFGAMSFWWMGEHGSSRLDTSEHVYFSNDQLAVLFIEEIDFDYAAVDATAATRPTCPK